MVERFAEQELRVTLSTISNADFDLHLVVLPDVSTVVPLLCSLWSARAEGLCKSYIIEPRAEV